MSMAGLFMSFLFGGLLQLLDLQPRVRKLLALVLFALQGFLFYQLLRSESFHILNVGNWPHYAGISWLSDGLSLFFVGSLLVLFPPAYFALLRHYEEPRMLLALLHFFAAGILGSFFTADLFNLFVMFEIFLICSYTFFARAEKLSAGKLYIWSNILASALYLIVVSYIYKSLGTVSLADLAVRFESLRSDQQNFLYWTMGFVFLVKAGIWPLYMWMPSSYPSVPPSLLAFFGVLSSKVGLYAFIRWTCLVGWEPLAAWKTEFQVLCFLTLLFAAGAAFSANNLRSSIAYWSLSHIGLSLLSLSLAQPLGISALLIYFIQDVIVTAGLFYFCDSHERALQPRKLLTTSPRISFIFILLALSASGFPLTSGFWGKVLFLEAAVNEPLAFLTVIFSAIFFLSLVISLWNRYFVGSSESPQGAKLMKLSWQSIYCLVLSIVCIWVAFAHRERIDEFASKVVNKSVYIEAMMYSSQQTRQEEDE